MRKRARRLAVQLPQKEKLLYAMSCYTIMLMKKHLRNEVLSCVKERSERNDENGGQL
ncbi:MAG: hypothetical protein ACLVJ6_01790 [Merdibacter sp.]